MNKHSSLLWEDANLRLRVITLLNEVYSQQLYRILRIDAKQGSHEIFAALQSVHADTLGEFDKINSSIVSVDTAINIRRSYNKLLSAPATLIFSENQIYDQSLVSKERVAEVFNALEQYAQADRLHALAAFAKFKDISNAYFDDINRHGKNIYVKSFVESILRSIFNIACQSFEDSDLQAPASLAITTPVRKYPLHVLDELFSVKIALTNHGPGVAFDTQINLLQSDESLVLETEEINLGTVDAGRHEFIVRVKSRTPCADVPAILGVISWSDYKGDRAEEDFEILVTPQNGTVDWPKIKYQQPYSLESIDSEDELVGRKDLLENISSKLSLRKGESSIIYGQKRVGKTSLARTIENRFKNKEHYATIFIETGSLDKTSAQSFIRSLGEKIIRYLKRVFPFENSGQYQFEGSLHPLVTCIEDIVNSNDKARIIIILDEFDELPAQLYPYTEEGDSFFHNLRSLSGESGEGRVSLILVGGENMNVIMQSTDKLNKFDAWNVGYFNKSEYWEDFKALLVTPVHGVIEYSDEAILKLYETTEGNPFYTKFVAKNLYKKMCEKRCAFISIDEMESAIRDTILNMEAINLNHFWSDGIRVEDPERKDLIETQRRRLLIAFADKLRSDPPVQKKDLIDDKSLAAIPCREILESFVSRNIVVEDGSSLRIKPRIFESWLVEKGVHTLRASFADEDSQRAFNERESASYIADGEIIDLSEKWELYRGTQVGPSHVRAWLDQFENNNERRIAFKLLQNVKFYGESKVREKLRIIHDTIKREVIHSVKAGERVRKDLLISAFGELSKSGATYVRMYASENGITSHSVKSYTELRKSLLADESIKAIVFIDDIVASGGTVIECLSKLSEDLGEILSAREILVVIGFICGVAEGIEKANKFIEEANFDFKIILRACDVLDSSHKAFNIGSSIFEETEKLAALAMARKYGARLQGSHPLGYQDGQLLVVFKDNCPNNTLPIIWSGSSSPKWVPLFKRS